MSSQVLESSKKQLPVANKKLVISAGIISCATLCSRVLGFWRDMIIAKIFGAQMVSDAFFAAFRIPNLLRHLMGEGALSSSFVPVFMEYLHQKSKDEAWDMVNHLISSMGLILMGLVLLSVIFAPLLVRFLAPGYYYYPEKFSMTVLLTRILFPYIFFIGLASIFMGILNSFHHFLVPAFSPALLNIAMILSLWFIVPRVKEPIIGLACGVLLGGLIQFLSQIPLLISKGIKFRLAFDFGDEGWQRIIKLMLPSTLGLAVVEINCLVDTLLASFLPDGIVSYLYYGYRLIQFPLGLFGMAIGTAILPTMSAQSAKGDIQAVRDTFSFGLRLVMFVTIPATVGLLVCRQEIITILFQRGAFTAAATQGTSRALLFYTLGLLAYAGVRVAVPVFYSLKDIKTPLKIGILSIILHLALTIILIGPLGHGGLALSTALASFFNFLALVYYLRNTLGRLGGRTIMISGLKVSLASVFMGISTWLMIRLNGWITSDSSSALVLMTIILISMVLYMAVSFLMKSQEISFLMDNFWKKI